jgi:Uma2 family endonuclease
MTELNEAKQRRFLATPEEYLAYEEDAQEKHEWRDGEVIAMPGASDRHCVVNANVIGEIHARLKGGPCRIRTSDLRVRTPVFRQSGSRGKGFYTYPDATVVCGKPAFDRMIRGSETLTNPTLIVEVLSPSTQHYDVGGKMGRYQTIESFQEYVLVGQSEASVQVFLRRENGDWKISSYTGLDAVARLDSIDVDLPLAEVYDGITFDELDPDAAPDEQSADEHAED